MCFHPPFQHLDRLKLPIEMVLDSAHVVSTPSSFQQNRPRMFNFTPPGSVLLLSSCHVETWNIQPAGMTYTFKVRRFRHYGYGSGGLLQAPSYRINA